MISSFYDGRVRIRHKALKQPELMTQVKKMLGEQNGVTSMEENPRTGSLLVHYDPAVISRETLAQAACMLEEYLAGQAIKEAQPKTRSRVGLTGFTKRLRSGKRFMGSKQETMLMSGFYGLTMLGGFMNKRVHIASGVMFTALALMHVYARRRRLK